jgi:hypothetical protein
VGNLGKKPRLNESLKDGTSIDINQVVSIARSFLMQYHSPVIFKSSCLNGRTWVISMEVGLLKEDIIAVRIDAETGKILGYDHLLPS